MPISDPRDISGLVLWYSAEAETSYADGASMTGWTDLSGNGNHATAQGTLAPQWEAATGPGSGPAVKFRGTHGSTSATWGYFSLPASVMGSAAAGEILTQVKSDGQNCSLWGLGITSGTSAASHYPYDSAIYEGFGTTSRKTVGFPEVAITDWRRYNVWSAASDWSARIDTTVEFSTASNTVLWDTTPVIGHGKRSGALSTNLGSFQGHMSAVILYNRKLTTTERADLDAWLVANPNGGTLAAVVPTVDLAGEVDAPTWSLTGAFDLAPVPIVYALDLSGTVAAPAAWTVDGAFGLVPLTPADLALDGTVAAPSAWTVDGTFEVDPRTTTELAGEVEAPTWGITATFDLDTTPLGQMLALDATIAAPEWSLSGAFDLVPSAVLVPIDLATFVDLYETTAWDGSALSATSGAAYFTFPLYVDSDTTDPYTIEVDYTQVTATPGGIYVSSLLGPTEAQADVSLWELLGSSSGLTGTGTATITIGPGLMGWAAAMAAEELFLVFDVSELDITGIRVGPALTAQEALPPIGVDTTDRLNGRSRSGLAQVRFEPAVVLPPYPDPDDERHVGAAAFSAVAMVGAQPVYTVSEATKKRTRHRIIVGGKDVSFYRDVKTPEPSYQLAEPLLWGRCTIEFPQIAAAFEEPGKGQLRWCRKGAPVVLQRVTTAGEIVSVDYRGVVVGHDVSNGTLRVELGGHAQGRAALRYKPLPIFRDTLDLGRLAWAAIHDMGLRFEPRLGPTTGVKQALWGGMYYLDYISELCAKAWERDGTQWTVMPSDAAVYRMQPKDRTTVDFTIFTDDKRAVPNLRSDAAEERNRIFASGVTPKGQRVRFGVYPGLKPSGAAPYPYVDERIFGQFTTDEDTDTGDGITILVRTLWGMGYLSLEDASGEYDADVTRAIMSLQDGAGLTPTGNVNVATWEALFDVGTTGYTLRGSRIEPAAQAPRTRRVFRAASGRILRKNPAFDRHALIVDKPLEFGAGFTRHQMREWSSAEIARGEDNWVGVIEIKTGGVLHGQVAPGTIIGGDDIMDVRAIQPGMNAWLPLFAGGILVHVSGVEISYDGNGIPTAKLYVDTQARDAMTVWEIVRRNRESKSDPARRWKGNRSSSELKDSITEWDEVGGVLYDDVDLQPGWNVIPVVAGQEGSVSRIRLVVQDIVSEGGTVTIHGREFACAVFGRKVTPARLRHLIGNPLAASPVATAEPVPADVDPPETDPEADDADPAPTVTPSRPWWERKAIADALRDLDMLHSAGTHEEPCGYSPGKKANGGTRTGLYRRDASFSYRTRRDPVVYLAVWVWGPRTLSGGRVMWNQLESGS